MVFAEKVVYTDNRDTDETQIINEHQPLRTLFPPH